MTLPSAVVAQFKQPHGLWGRAVGSIMAHRPSNRRRNLWTVELLQVRPDDRVLEIGCGPGLALAACAEHLLNGRVTGLDHSATMLEQARKRNRQAIAGDRVELMLGDLTSLAEIPHRFDKLFSVNVVQFFDDREAAFRTLLRVTAADGLVASTYQPRHARATRADALRMASDIEQAMAAAGFVDIGCEELGLKPVPAICVIGRRHLPSAGEIDSP